MHLILSWKNVPINKLLFINNMGRRKVNRKTSKFDHSYSSLLELCENEEWRLIIDSIPEKILSWDFQEKNKKGENALAIFFKKKAVNVIKRFIKYNNIQSPNGISMILLASGTGQLEILNGC